MHIHKEVNIPQIEQTILKISNVVKEVAAFMHVDHPYLPICKKCSANIPTAALQMYKHPGNLIEYLHILQVDAYHPEDKITIL